MDRYLVLEDGSVFSGIGFGGLSDNSGEMVFNTTMTGYQEVLTDPSYAGQIVNMTYPLIGNYGINLTDSESSKIQVAGMLVRELCDTPSHTLSVENLDNFMKSQHIPGIRQLDTRAIAKRIRTSGVMRGLITDSPDASVALKTLKNLDAYGDINFVNGVSTNKISQKTQINDTNAPRVVISDCGVKNNIIRMLSSRGCEVISVPDDTSYKDILDLKPDGLLVSPGPGDPNLLEYIGDNIKELIGKMPIMGICLGHQIIAESLGAKTFKLKFGHRGGNHPVQDLRTRKVYITAQNHGYAVDPKSLPLDLKVSHVNLNDGTVEGLVHETLPLFTIQYHSEAAPGPMDNTYLFDEFVHTVKTMKAII
ncbi:MAG: glutamine-hydrolyzing carbamoyl-phosphate synthase small subunit [Dehalococcoidia bacterium]|tara:strand:- start:3259 stop:4350 length:1092 start_codon:yes stop_codon:yes gene_type:complete